MAEKQHQFEVHKNNDQTQSVADRMTFETGLERPTLPALSPAAFQLKADGTQEEKLKDLEASESDMSNYLFASGAAALPNDKPSPNASPNSAEVTQQKKAPSINTPGGVIQKQGSNLDLLETGGHPKRNQHNRFPVGLLAPVDGASPNYTYTEDGSNLYQDEEGQIWELYPDSKNIFHQPDDWDGSGTPPNKKFLSKDGSGGSYEAILQPDSDGNYTNSWLNTGSKQGTYNFYHPEGIFGNVMHGIFDVLPHFLNDDYDSTPAQKKEASNPPPFQYKAPSTSSSSSTPLPEPFQAKMESAFKADFSNVNIHENSQSAKDVGALAYTKGNDVHFAPGQFKPDTTSGQELLGHELTHVLQQREGRVKPTTQSAGMPVNDDRGLESEADDMGRKAAQFKLEDSTPTAKVSTDSSNAGGAVQKKEDFDTEPEVNVPEGGLNTPSTTASPASGGLGEDQTEEENENIHASLTEGEPTTAESEEQETRPEEEVAAKEENSEEDTTNKDQGKEEVENVEKGGEALEKSEGEEVKEADNPELSQEGDVKETPTQPAAEASAEEAKAEKNTEAEGKLNQATGLLNQATGELASANANASSILGQKVSFKKPEEGTEGGTPIQRQAANGEGEPSWEDKNAAAQAQIESFKGSSLAKINQISQIAETLPAQIEAAAASAKAQIQASLSAQIASTQSNTARLIEVASSKKAETIANITAAAETARTNISSQTDTAIEQLVSDFENANTRLDTLESNQLAALETSYTTASNNYREVGTTVGQEAIDLTATIAQGHDANAEAERAKGHSMLDGPYKRERHEARAKVARDVGAAYNTDLITQANEQATAVLEGKALDIQNIQAQINDYRELILQQFDTNQKVLLDVETQLLGEVDTEISAKTNQAEAIYQASVTSLQASDAQIVSSLTAHAQEQESAVEATAQEIIATLKTNAAQLVDSLTDGVLNFLNSINDSELPDAGLLQETLARVSASIDNAIQTGIGGLQEIVQRGSSASTAIAGQAGESLGLLGERGRTDMEQQIITEGLTTQLSGLEESTTQLFTSMEQSFTETAGTITSESSSSFDATVTGLEEYFVTANEAMNTHFEESKEIMATAFRDAVAHSENGVAATAKRLGDEQASSIQPRWKKILAVIIAIVVVVVIILVAGPAIIAAAGAFAGALGATGLAATVISGAVAGAAIGAIVGPITTAATNLLMDKPWSEGVVDSIWQGALMGAAGGAIGGAVSHGIKASLSGMSSGFAQNALQKGLEFTADIGQDYLTSLVTGQDFNIFESAAMSLASNAAMSRVETRIDTGSPDYNPNSWSARSAEAGRGAGEYAGNKVNSVREGIGNFFNPPEVTTPDIPTTTPSVRPETEVTTPPSTETTPSTSPEVNNTSTPPVRTDAEGNIPPSTDTSPNTTPEVNNNNTTSPVRTETETTANTDTTPTTDTTPKTDTTPTTEVDTTPKTDTTVEPTPQTAKEKAAALGLPEAPPGYHYNQTKNGDLYIKRTSNVDADGNLVVPKEIVDGKLVNKDPSSYLPPEVIAEHLAKFDDGAGYFVPKDALDTYGRELVGRPDGQFIMTKAEMQRVIQEANGDVAKLEELLGIPEGSWQGREIVRIEIDKAALENAYLRMPSGNEGGANELWMPGGRTSGGVDEAVVNQIPEGQYRETGAFEDGTTNPTMDGVNNTSPASEVREISGNNPETTPDDLVRGMAKDKPQTESDVISGDGRSVHLDFHNDIPVEIQHLIRKIEANGSARVESIHPDDLTLVSQWFGKEIGVVQSPYHDKLRVVLGEERTIRIRPGEVFVVHTHPVFTSDRSHFGTDLKNAGEHVEGVVDWNGRIIYFNEEGVLNPRDSRGNYEDMSGSFKSGFLDADGNIIGYAKVEFQTNPDGSTIVKVIK